MDTNKYDIEVACDQTEGAEFVGWLRSKGHYAKMGKTTEHLVDGVPSDNIIAANRIRNLWNEYCNEV